MRSLVTLPVRLSAVLLTLALTLPPPVFALRAGLEGTTERKVEAALTTPCDPTPRRAGGGDPDARDRVSSTR